MADEFETISLLIDGGEAKPGGAIAPALGPLGLNLGKVVADINTNTNSFKGMKVPVSIVVNKTTRSYIIEVGLPPTSALILNKLGLSKGSGTSGHEIIGNATFEDIMDVANSKKSDLLATSLATACKEVLGTMVCMGLTCDSIDVREVQKKISAGDYDDQLNKFTKNTPY